jgi:hypothetical protein
MSCAVCVRDCTDERAFCEHTVLMGGEIVYYSPIVADSAQRW